MGFEVIYLGLGEGAMGHFADHWGKFRQIGDKSAAIGMRRQGFLVMLAYLRTSAST
jgi:hypothetical protein